MGHWYSRPATLIDVKEMEERLQGRMLFTLNELMDVKREIEICKLLIRNDEQRNIRRKYARTVRIVTPTDGDSPSK